MCCTMRENVVELSVIDPLKKMENNKGVKNGFNKRYLGTCFRLLSEKRK